MKFINVVAILHRTGGGGGSVERSMNGNVCLMFFFFFVIILWLELQTVYVQDVPYDPGVTRQYQGDNQERLLLPNWHLICLVLRWDARVFRVLM